MKRILFLYAKIKEKLTSNTNNNVILIYTSHHHHILNLYLLIINVTNLNF